MKKKENKTLKEFDFWFNALISKISGDLKPPKRGIVMHYTNAFFGQFGFTLKDKSPQTLQEAQDKARNIDSIIQSSDSKEMFQLLSFGSFRLHSPDLG